MPRRGISMLSLGSSSFLVREVGLDPREEVEVHLELARRYLEKGRLASSDPMQVSKRLYRRLYRAAEGAGGIGALGGGDGAGACF